MGIVAYIATKELLGEPEVVLATLIIGSLFGTALILPTHTMNLPETIGTIVYTVT